MRNGLESNIEPGTYISMLVHAKERPSHLKQQKKIERDSQTSSLAIFVRTAEETKGARLLVLLHRGLLERNAAARKWTPLGKALVFRQLECADNGGTAVARHV